MNISKRLVPFFQKIDEVVLKNWKDTVTGNESFRGRLEEALKKDTLEYRKKLVEKFKNG